MLDRNRDKDRWKKIHTEQMKHQRDYTQLQTGCKNETLTLSGM